MQNNQLALIASITIAVTTLATSTAATQLAFAQGGGGTCVGCRFLDVSGSGSTVCGDNTIYPSTIDISATSRKGGGGAGTVSGNLTIFTDSGLVGIGTITSGKITGARYSLEGIWDPNGICGVSGTATSFSVSARIGTQVPINFQSNVIAGSTFTGTAQITTTTPG